MAARVGPPGGQRKPYQTSTEQRPSEQLPQNRSLLSRASRCRRSRDAVSVRTLAASHAALSAQTGPIPLAMDSGSVEICAPPPETGKGTVWVAPFPGSQGNSVWRSSEAKLPLAGVQRELLPVFWRKLAAHSRLTDAPVRLHVVETSSPLESADLEAVVWTASWSSLVCLLASIHDPVATLHQGAGPATNSVDLRIVIPAAVAGIGITPKDPDGRAVRATDHPTPGAAIIIRPHCVPRKTSDGGVIWITVVARRYVEPPRLSLSSVDRQRKASLLGPASGEQCRNSDCRGCDCKFSQSDLLHEYSLQY
jgi:hypothetical protein